jgi:hypothetical protein
MEAFRIVRRAQRLANRVDTDFDDRGYEFLNEAVREWALTHPWSTLHKEVDLTYDGGTHLVLPPYVLSVRFLVDASNKNQVDNIGDWDRRSTPAFVNRTAGSASWWQEDGVQPVLRQPSEASYVSVLSTVSESSTAYIAGSVFNSSYSGTAGEYEIVQETIDYNSATGATSEHQYTEIFTYGKSARQSGNLKLFSNDDRLLATIQADQYDQPYRRVRFLFNPQAGTVFKAGVILNPPPLYKQHQHPHASIDSDYLAWYTASLIHKAMGQEQRAMMAMATATTKLNRKAQFEQHFGDRDWGAAPDNEYWGHENQHEWTPFD